MVVEEPEEAPPLTPEGNAALVDDSGDRPRLRYVFDISDTGTLSLIHI